MLAGARTTRRGFLLGGAGSLVGAALARPSAANAAPLVPPLPPFSWRFKRLLWEAAQSCRQDDGLWLVPSGAYSEFYTRDSFWLIAALQERPLAAEAVRKLAEDQRENADGHVATLLRRDGARSADGDPDDESTLLFVLHNLLLARLGGEPDREALARAQGFVDAHVQAGKYVTRGAQRPEGSLEAALGAYHYWVDTYRPAGSAEPVGAVIAYNQGLYALALSALVELGLSVPPEARQAAEAAYAALTDPADGLTLVQREGSTNLDVSALVGEALSLYLYNHSLLGKERVAATLARLPAVHYADGAFLGYKVLSTHLGAYLSDASFFPCPTNHPGNYHNGGSWLLYDALALYAGLRHELPGMAELFQQRLESEVRYSWASHEYLSTDAATLGGAERYRDGYGWNAFVLNLLPWDGYYPGVAL